MKTSGEIASLKEAVNNLIAQNALLISSNQSFQSAFIEFVANLFPGKEKILYTSFVDKFELSGKQAISDIDPMLFDDGSLSFLLRQKILFSALIDDLKDSDLYGNISD